MDEDFFIVVIICMVVFVVVGGFIAGFPTMNTFYIWLICWGVGLVTYVLLSFRRTSKGMGLNASGSILVLHFYDDSRAPEMKCEVIGVNLIGDEEK